MTKAKTTDPRIKPKNDEGSDIKPRNDNILVCRPHNRPNLSYLFLFQDL